jgi:hypothetical protein
MRLAAKVDGNHAEIVCVLRELGFSVVSLARIGRGCPDLCIARDGKTWLAEIKNNAIGWKLTADQRKFHNTWEAPIPIFNSVETVLMWAKNGREIYI